MDGDSSCGTGEERGGQIFVRGASIAHEYDIGIPIGADVK
jgi:hypothetical protein